MIDTKRDFEQMMMSESHEVTEEYTTDRGTMMRLTHLLLRLIAPLL